MPSKKALDMYFRMEFDSKPTERDPNGCDGLYVKSLERIPNPFVTTCEYCGDKKDRCHKCSVRIQFDVLIWVGKLEQTIARMKAAQDNIDIVGITDQMRAIWGLRDCLNDYFNKDRGNNG